MFARLLPLVAVFVITLVGWNASAIAAGAKFISAPQAVSEVQAGNMVLLDIRSPQEWKESGVPEGALPLSMHTREFLVGFQKVVAENPGKQIGIICATGGRTQWLQAELAKRGLGQVIDVSEGVFGNRNGPGWIARGLPMKKMQ